MSDGISKPESLLDNSGSYDSDDDMDVDRNPLQLFGQQCENWEDVYTLFETEHPELLEKFLLLYRTHLR